jgi:hypothetical protein
MGHHEDTFAHAKINQPDPYVGGHRVVPTKDLPICRMIQPPKAPDRTFNPGVGDAVNMPMHYARFKIEPLHYAVENRLNAFQFSINKYIMRAEHKHNDNGQEDLLKAIRFTVMYAKFLLGNPYWWKPYGKDFTDAIKKELHYAN